MRSTTKQVGDIHAPTAALPAAARRRSKDQSLEALEDRKLMATTSFDIGINLNSSTDAAYQKAVPILKKLGVQSVRIWHSVSDFTKPKLEGSLKRAIQAGKDGFDVMLIVSTKDGKIPSAAAVKKWFQWAMDNRELKNAVDRWEIGNEPDLKHYWRGTLKEYVNGFLKPAAQVLRANGEEVVSAGPSWNPNDVKEMISYGMLDYVDYVGYHPYAKGVSLVKQRINEINAVVAGRKPIIASEWNVRGYEKASKNEWAKAIEDAYKNIKNGFAQNFYFVAFTMDSMAGPAGILKPDGSINQPFYNAFATFSKQSGGGAPAPIVGSPSLPPSNNNGNNSSNSGNKPSSVSATLALYNADTDKVISGYTSINNGEVINLATLPTRKLALVVDAAKAESVKMTLNGKTVVQDGVPYAYFNDINGDLIAGTLKPGDYTMVITPYSRDGAKGTPYATRTIKFKVVDKPTSSSGSSSGSSGSSKTNSSTKNTGNKKGLPEVSSFSLVNAKTGQVLAQYASLTGDIRIKTSDLKTNSLAVRVNADDDTGSVRLSGAGVTRVENAVPYSLFGDNGRYGSLSVKAGKSYTLSATAYALDNAHGTKGTSMTIKVTFI